MVQKEKAIGQKTPASKKLKLAFIAGVFLLAIAAGVFLLNGNFLAKQNIPGIFQPAGAGTGTQPQDGKNPPQNEVPPAQEPDDRDGLPSVTNRPGVSSGAAGNGGSSGGAGSPEGESAEDDSGLLNCSDLEGRTCEPGKACSGQVRQAKDTLECCIGKCESA